MNDIKEWEKLIKNPDDKSWVCADDCPIYNEVYEKCISGEPCKLKLQRKGLK